ncbi:MAG TPA: glycoside hydrolase family 30 beta sandwich domain-containing protein [Bacilli bacterium]|jgi:glucosylceramidase|nr:MAG: Glucuronoxylanase XynC precursor [Tenericutes bacterium ADurb.Bin140]HON63327.1 glycoside hydrolase family 30 beta sandwich domain-containing protein [Bacilli bacterium]HPD11756.1 glycoside hydrolase family 30 beta sandwich domain-containing protein [Bacilli bacterium]HRU48488.1 glycoside hydrolase family 30 beta sandwich domain-containing protein [Bacilli bacterium]
MTIQKIKCYQTDYRKNEYFLDVTDKQKSIKTDGPFTTIYLNPNRKKQRIIGFGGAFTESASYVYYNSDHETKKRIIEGYFGQDGLRYNLGRLSVHSCDFSLNSYTYIEECDESLNSFTIEREKIYVLPFVKAAKTLQPDLQLMAAPWSPPAFMKTNGRMNYGGKLKEEYYPLWAGYLIKYLEEMKKHGHEIEYLSIQNEPEAVQVWESCIYTPKEAIAFAKVLGPLLKEKGFRQTKVILLDHNRDLIAKWMEGIAEDPEVLPWIWGIGIHWYVSEDFDKVALIKETIPSLHVIFTEGCQEGGVRLGSIQTGERYARNIIGDFTRGCEGFIDWNLVLDEHGGPNHVGNFCDAPMIVKDNQVIFKSSYYYIGHFSKFLLPSAFVIDSMVSDKDLSVLAGVNPDGRIVVVILNETDRNTAYQIAINNQKIDGFIPAHTIQTWCLDE